MLGFRRFAACVAVAVATSPATAAPPAAAPPAPAPAAAAPPADTRAALTPLARSLIDGEYCAGIVIALITPDRPPQLLAWGETVRGNHKPPDARTVFEIGSVTKTFTSTLLGEAVIDHQVTLDTPVTALLPPGTGMPASTRPITLLDLATHSSGLPRMPDNVHPADPGNPYADYTVAQLYAFLATGVLHHEPGVGYEYSNLGAGLLGHALATRAKLDWSELVATEITRPLALTSTMVALTPDARARLAQGYDDDGEPVKPWDMAALAGAGALRSTASDLVTFVQAELAAAAPGTTGRSRGPTSRLARAMALTQQPARALDDKHPGKIGLAWMIRPDGTVWHGGQTGGYHTFIAFQPAQQRGIVMLASGSAVALDGLAEAALAAVSGAAIPAKLALPPPDIALAASALDAYVGTYSLAMLGKVSVVRDGGKLYGILPDQHRVRLHPTAPDEFVVHLFPGAITFEVDPHGKVIGAMLRRGGQQLHATRDP